LFFPLVSGENVFPGGMHLYCRLQSMWNSCRVGGGYWSIYQNIIMCLLKVFSALPWLLLTPV